MDDCHSSFLYQSWGKQLTEMSSHNARVEDVSMLLGAPPTRCEPVESQWPLIGTFFTSKEAVVKFVTPNSPAYQAGIRPGDRIISINSQSVIDGAQTREALHTYAREGEPLHIVTNRGALEVVPKFPKAEQCYWELQAGRIARTGGGSFINQYGGASSSGGSAYERFFRASCRIHDGYLAGCRANWQE
jgi:membrane-associated protease RseP (regulator of RpoE activity)